MRAEPNAPGRLLDLDPIRVLLVGMSALLGEIIRETIAGQPDMQIVDELPDDHRLVFTDRPSRWDAVIMASVEGGELSAGGLRLQGACPSVAIVALSGDGRYADVYHGQRQRVRLEDPSGAALMEALRAAVGPRPRRSA
jgi:hypothetical protein